MVADKEIHDKEYVGCGEDSAGVDVNLLNAVKSVAATLTHLIICGGGGVV